MGLASDTWNALPREERKRLHGVLISTQLRDLGIEADRAKSAHRAHMAKINAHIKSIEQELARWERQQQTDNPE